MASSVNAQSQICCNSCICHPEWPASPPLLLFARPISPSHGSSDPNFPIVVVAIVGILATAFLLVSYYAIVAKCYRNLDTVARRLHGIHSFVNRQNPQTESWSLQDNGLEESVIQSIPVCKYTRQGGFIEGTECAVCLNEFQEDERLRLLPKCSHAFHLHCIDTWLQSHSNCPLCRANIMNPSLESVQFVHTESSSDSTTLQHVAEVIDEGQILRARNGLNALDNVDEVAPNAPVDKNEAKENATAEIIAGPRSPLKKLNPPVSSLTHTRTVSDLASKVPRGYACIPPLKNQNLGEEMQPMRRSFSMDSSSHRLCISITELLAMHPGLHDVNASDGSSSTKRSFFFFGNSRGRNAILPI